jgi:hypothetical protein
VKQGKTPLSLHVEGDVIGGPPVETAKSRVLFGKGHLDDLIGLWSCPGSSVSL